MNPTRRTLLKSLLAAATVLPLGLSAGHALADNPEIRIGWREHGFTALLVTHDISEAVALVDRVLLIEDGSIALDLHVPLPRPRERGSAFFAALEDDVLRRVLQHPPLEEESAPHPQLPIRQGRFAA